MQYTTLGRTQLRVSVAGLGGGGFSRLASKPAKRKTRLPASSSKLSISASTSSIPRPPTAPRASSAVRSHRCSAIRS